MRQPWVGRLICNQNKTKQTTYLCRSLQRKSIFKPLFAGENDNLPVALVVISHVSFYIRLENVTEKKKSKTSIKRQNQKKNVDMLQKARTLLKHIWERLEKSCVYVAVVVVIRSPGNDKK